MNVYLTVPFVIFFCVASVHGQSLIGSGCVVQSSGLSGTWTFLIQCKKLRDNLIQEQLLPQVCGFQGTQSIVCCPNAKEPGDILKQKCQEYAKYAVNENGEKICKHRINKRIANGSKAERREFPHMAALSFNDNPLSGKWQCGGVIITELYILTLGRCTLALPLGPVKYVLVGVTNLNDTDHRQLIKVDKIFTHPNYQQGNSEHDIGLLKLEKPIELNSYARPACLYTKFKIEVDEAIATGWGRTELGSVATDLQQVTLSFLDTKSCNETYKTSYGYEIIPHGIREDIHLCATGSNGKDTCAGDSGGPLQIEHTNDDIECMYDVVGLTSFGSRACNGNASVYTRIYPYLGWIEKTIWG